MWHRVAALLGRTVAEAQASMSSAEFADWCAFYLVEPWGYEAATWRMAVLATATANYASGLCRPRHPLDLPDFIPGADRPQARQSPEQMRRAMAEILGNREQDPTDD